MSSDECLILLGSDGKVAWIDATRGGFLGYTRDELAGMQVLHGGAIETDSPSVLAPVADAIRTVRDGGLRTAEGDAVFRTKDGGGAGVHWRLALLPATSGHTQMLLTLAASACPGGEAFPGGNGGHASENALEGIFRATMDGVLLEANAVFARMFGHASAAEMLRSVKNIGCELAADPERSREFFDTMAGKGSVEGFELELVRSNGSLFWVAAHARTLPAQPGEPAQFEGRVVDITKQKRAEHEAERSRGQLRELTARLDQVREDERADIARELHDELGKSLTLLSLDLAWFRGRLPKAARSGAREPLEEKIAKMEQTIKQTLDTLRRIVAALRPPLLDEMGLKEAIEFELQEFSRRMGIRFEMKANPVAVPSDRTRMAVFRIFEEVLTNVARHSRASRVRVNLSDVDSTMVLTVDDNGCGLTEESLVRTRGFGILGIQERARGIGGHVEFSGKAGSGTKVILRVPLEGSDATAGSSSVAGTGDGTQVGVGPDDAPQRVFEFDEGKAEGG
jgi:PAS domain S-box-containing protein